MFLRSAWYVVGWSTEFEAGKLYGRTIINEPLVLFRKQDGTLIALTDRCPHRWAPLSSGRIEHGTVRCMYHGVRFDADGRCVEVPRQQKISSVLNARAYPVVERHSWTWVWMGDADAADPSLIPDASLLDDDRRRVYYGQLDYQASYQLENDNLLDLSHVGFVHENTLGRRVATDGAPPPVAGGSRSLSNGAGAQLIDRGVRNDSWIRGKTSLMPDAAPPGDIWIRVDYMVPGIFIQRVFLYPEGTINYDGPIPPGPEIIPISDFMSCQAVTPTTERTTRYFYSVGNQAYDMEVTEADAKFKIVEAAFGEDTVMIEAQQRMIDFHPGKRMNWIDADRGLNLFRSLMNRLMTDERDRPLHGETALISSS